MPFGFSFGKKPAAAVGPAPTAEEQKRLDDEARQVTAVTTLKNILSAESDKSLKRISDEVFARIKNSKTERSKELKNLHDKLTTMDLQAAVHFLYTVKGVAAPGTPASYAYAPITRAPVPAGPAVGSAAAPAAVSAPVQYIIQQPGFTPIGPAQGFQQGATSARNQALASAGSGIRNVFGKMGFGPKGGAKTRRNLRKRKSRGTIPSVGRDTSTGIRASGTNKVTRRR